MAAAISIRLDNASLFLDLDGTLAQIAERPEDVGPDAGRNALLRAAGRALEGRLAVISGRSIVDVDRVTEGAVACVAGVHGLERRDASGAVRRVAPHPRLAEVQSELQAFARDRPGLRLEPKSLSVALHYRQAPHAAADVLEIAGRLGAATGLKLQKGHMVAELRPEGADKGQTIRDYLAEPPFRGTQPIFIGDDVTDEDGFAAVRDLGGLGVLVGPWRKTAAAARLADVTAVLDWLRSCLAAGAFEIEAG